MSYANDKGSSRPGVLLHPQLLTFEDTMLFPRQIPTQYESSPPLFNSSDLGTNTTEPLLSASYHKDSLPSVLDCDVLLAASRQMHKEACLRQTSIGTNVPQTTPLHTTKPAGAPLRIKKRASIPLTNMPVTLPNHLSSSHQRRTLDANSTDILQGKETLMKAPEPANLDTLYTSRKMYANGEGSSRLNVVLHPQLRTSQDTMLFPRQIPTQYEGSLPLFNLSDQGTIPTESLFSSYYRKDPLPSVLDCHVLLAASRQMREEACLKQTNIRTNVPQTTSLHTAPLAGAPLRIKKRASITQTNMAVTFPDHPSPSHEHRTLDAISTDILQDRETLIKTRDILYEDGTIRAFLVGANESTNNVLSLCTKPDTHLRDDKYFDRKCAVTFYLEESNIAYKVGTVGGVCRSKTCPLYRTYRVFVNGDDGEFVCFMTKNDLKDKLVAIDTLADDQVKRDANIALSMAQGGRCLGRSCKNTAAGSMAVQDRIVDSNGKVLKVGSEARSFLAECIDMDGDCIDVADRHDVERRKRLKHA